MTPQEALQLISTYGESAGVPPIYKHMPTLMLQNLAEECARPSLEKRLDARAARPLGYVALDRALGREQPITVVVPVIDRLPKPLEKAIANPRRLRTPGRPRAAFLRQLERCPTVAEAAARAGVNRGTVYRWRDRDPAFAERWVRAIARQSEEVDDNVVLRAARPELRPRFYAGKQVGEYQRFNDRLQIHLQKRLDAERRRAEDRAERRALAELARRPAATIDEAALAVRIANLLRSHAATPAATPAVVLPVSESNSLPAVA